MINWRVRIKNKNFWLAFVPAVILLVQAVASVFGFQLNLENMGHKILAVVEAVFVVLSLVGIVNDPTTEGLQDSNLALTYEEPKKKGE